MKLFCRLRSLAAAIVCSAMVLCNVPLVRAADIVVFDDIAGNIAGNGLEPLKDAADDEVYPIGGYTSGDPGSLGDPNNNSVSVLGGNQNSIHGGYIENGAWVENNSVTVMGGRIKNLHGGYVANSGSSVATGYAVNNEVEIIDGIVDEGVYGGRVESGEASGNKVAISGGYPGPTINGSVYGGYAENGWAAGNEVTIDGRVRGDIAGGYAGTLTSYVEEGTTHNNAVTITSGANIQGDVYGGRSGSASNNEVNIEGGIITGAIIGGGSKNTDALFTQYNEVNISNNAVIVGNIYGGLVNIADALENEVTISGGLLTGNVYGGVTGFGNSVENMVYIEGLAVNNGNEIIGGQTKQGNATGNAVFMVDSRFLNNNASITGGYSDTGNANENFVYIDSGEFNIQRVTGGFSNNGNSNDNLVAIGALGGILNISTLAGGLSSNGSANNNSVLVFNGAFTDVYGGRTNGIGNASGNTVNIFGGSFNGGIYGGYSQSGAATGNTVNIFPGNAVFSTDTRIYGGFTNSPRNNARSGNTLNIVKPVTIAGLDNFENYNFVLPADFTADDTMIAVTGGNGRNGAINLKGANVGIGVENGSTLQKGDTVILIDERGGFGFNGAPANNTSDNTMITDNSGLVNYTFGLKVKDNQLQASLVGTKLDSKAESLPDGFLSGIILVNQGADAIAGPAMDSAMMAAHKGPIGGVGGFGSLVFGKSKYDTGSNVDMFGVSAAAGLAIGVDFAKSSLTMGPFLEYGKGDYDTAANNVDAKWANGAGDSEYMGGGFLLRVDYKNVGLGRYFAEASVRAGKLKNDFSVNVSDVNENIETISYKSSAPYYGINLGYGGSWEVATKVDLDIYGKYFMTSGKNSEVTLSTEDTLNFGNLTSNRIRGGTRVAFAPGNQMTASFGGAYEYELSGEASASMLGYIMDDAPSLKGGTGIGEVVFGFKPSAASRTTINIGVQGYAGKRQGVTGNLFIRF